MILHVPDSLLARGAFDRFGRPLPPFDPTRWENHVSTIVGLAALSVLYLFAISRPGRGPEDRAHPWQVTSFFSGILVTFLALNGPVHDLSDSYLFSVHMVQHLVLTQLMPPLLLLGIPAFVLRPLLEPRWVRRTAALLSRPVVAFLVYTLSFSAWHLQPAYDLMMRNHDVHIVTHLQFMVTAVILWWPVLSPLPEYRMGRGAQLVYLFLAGIPMMFVAALITLSDVVLYPWYAPAPRVWGLSPLEDQKLGGLVMWVPGGMFYWVAMSIVFFRWVGEEQRADREEEARRATAAAALETPAGPAG